jgi:hypothetical protein
MSWCNGSPGAVLKAPDTMRMTSFDKDYLALVPELHTVSEYREAYGQAPPGKVETSD